MKTSRCNHLLALSLVVIVPTLGRAEPTNNLEIVAVPAPGKVVVDGKLDDWDQSASILSCPDTKTYLRTASVRSAAMYDAEGLYLSCRWVDPTPMENMVDPAEPGKFNQGWRSDCLQIRIFSDTQVHVTAWYFKGNGKMAMDINYDEPVGPNRKEGLDHGAKMAFQKNAGGTGYVQEMFIPWKLLSKAGKVYKAGDTFTFGLHFNWGKGDNKTWRGLEWQDVVSSPQCNRAFFWGDRNAWGKIRLSATGKLTLPAQPWDVQEDAGFDLTTHGPVAFTYELPADGLATLVIEDANGRRVRNLISAYPRAKGKQTDRWDGLDDSGKPVPPGAYRWHGLFHPGIDVRYQLHLQPVTNPPWQNAEGTGGWGADHGAPTYATAHGDRAFLLYHVAEGGSALLACDVHGNKLWGHGGAFQGGGYVCAADGKDLYYANEEKLTRVDPATGKARIFASGIPFLPHGFKGDEHPTGIAFRDDRLFLSAAKKNSVRVFDLKTDKPVKDLKVPNPMGLAFDGKGALLAVSGERLVRIDIKTEALTPLIETGLSKPHGLAVGADGLIHVVNAGTNQILTFAADGKPVRATGTAGGRAGVGKWDRDGLLQPTGVGVDGAGNLWVAEADGAAKRLSKWGQDGKNLGEWLGPTPYSGDGIVDHRDRTRIYCGGLEFKADWHTGASRPVWTHLRGPAHGQPACADLIAHGSFWHRQGFTLTFKGHDYLLFDRGLVCIQRGHAWTPCAAVGGVKNAGDALIWCDRNEDGKVQDDETTTLKAAGAFGLGAGGGWGTPWCRADLSTVRMRGDEVVRFTPAGFTPGGVPLFDDKSVTVAKLPVFGGNGGPVDVTADTMIAYYEDSHAPWVENLKDHPLGDMRGIKGYSRDAKLRWTYPQPFSGVHGCFKAPLPAKPGEVIGTIYIMGTADLGKDVGTVVCFNGYYGQRFLFSADGLFVQALFKDGRMMPATPNKAVKDMLMNDMSPGNEAYAGTFSRNQNGDVYLTGSFGGPMCVVSAVVGLDKIQRLSGNSLTVTAEQVALGLAERRTRAVNKGAEQEAKGTLRIAKGKRTIDGAFDDWDLKTQGVAVKADEKRSAVAALAHDDDFLYAAFSVQDNTPWRNAGKDPKVMFLTGDSVDIQLGLDPKADANRSQAVAGDVRLALAPLEGKPVVMLYQAVVPGFKGTKVPFISPIGRVDLDRVERIPSAKVEVKALKDRYLVEAAIPWSVLGGAPPKGAKLRGDVGVLFSDDLGTKCVLRRYWSNRDTNITSDLPSEIRFQPHEWSGVVVE